MRVLFVALVWPEPTSSAAGVRTLQLIECMRSAGYEVRVSSPCKSNAFRESLEERGISTVIYAPNDSSFDEYLRGYQPDIVVFDRFMAEEQFGWRVREHVPHALRILDTIDLHSLRRYRKKHLERALSELPQEIFSAEDGLRELAAIYRSDCSLIISDTEMALLTEGCRVPEELLRLCRIAYSLPETTPPFETRTHFVTIGNCNHEPNRDAIQLLHSVIWPKIRDHLEKRGMPGVELHVYGAYIPQHIQALDNAKLGFRVKGWAPDAVETLMRYRINLAPLRFGAGIKGKVAVGWVAGTPCIASSIAAEGMHEGLSFGGIVEDNWEKFAAEAAELYCSEARWMSAVEQGREIIQSLYTRDRTVGAFLDALPDLIETRDQRRSLNIVGGMLWLNQLRSTEYFSRWIELKNNLPKLLISAADDS